MNTKNSKEKTNTDKKAVIYTFRLPADIHAKLKEEADKMYIPIASYLKIHLRKTLNLEEK